MIASKDEKIYISRAQMLTGQAYSPRHFALSFKNPLKTLPEKCYHEEMVKQWRFTKFFWIISGAESLGELFKKHGDKFERSSEGRSILGPVIGKGLFTTSEDYWRTLRAALNQEFSSTSIGKFGRPCFEVAKKIVDQKQTSSSNVIQLKSWSWEIIDALVAQVFYGSTDNTPKNKSTKLDVDNTLKYIRTEEFKKRQDSTLVGSFFRAAQKVCLHNDQEAFVLENIFAMSMASRGTSSHTLAWTMHLLGRSLKWQDLVYDEICKVDLENTTELNLSNFPNLNLVLSESLRLFPSVPLLYKKAKSDFTLAGRDIKKNSELLIPYYALHRHKKYWQEPDLFNPNRFLNEEKKTWHQFQYLPFGAGMHNCIGRHLAQTFILSSIIAILQKYKVRSVEGDNNENFTSLVLLSPIDELPLIVENRKSP